MSSVAADLEPRIFGRTEAEVRAALQQAEPNVLRCALYAATRDPELASMKVEKKPFWGGAFQVSMIEPECASIVREKAYQFLRNGAAIT